MGQDLGPFGLADTQIPQPAKDESFENLLFLAPSASDRQPMQILTPVILPIIPILGLFFLRHHWALGASR